LHGGPVSALPRRSLLASQPCSSPPKKNTPHTPLPCPLANPHRVRRRTQPCSAGPARHQMHHCSKRAPLSHSLRSRGPGVRLHVPLPPSHHYHTSAPHTGVRTHLSC
jgi:hypothetical protein